MMTPTTGRGRQDQRIEAAPPNLFERLVGIMQENERLLLDLKAMTEKCQTARAYLASPDCNVSLALANLNRLRAKRSGLLMVLRANRIAGEELLATLECGAPAPRFGLN